jgi:hypothetical protein
MACWVVPSMAAEFWGITVEQVWTRVRDGSVASKAECGFTFVDVAPWAAEVPPARQEQLAERVPTFVPAAERDAQDEPALTGADEGDELESATFPTADRATVRQWVGRTRRAPRAA